MLCKTILFLIQIKIWRKKKKIYKIDKPLSKLTKWQRLNMPINKIRNEKGDITTDTEEVQ